MATLDQNNLKQNWLPKDAKRQEIIDKLKERIKALDKE